MPWSTRCGNWTPSSAAASADKSDSVKCADQERRVDPTARGIYGPLDRELYKMYYWGHGDHDAQ